MKWTLVFLIILFLLACGDDSSSSGSGGGVETGDAKQLIMEKPTYDGLRTVADIPQQQASKLIYDVLYNLDFLHSMSFFGEYKHFFLFNSNYQASLANDTLECTSGSSTTKEFEKDKIIEVTYDNCVSDGVKINGMISFKVLESITSSLPALNIVPDIEFTPEGSDEHLTVSGYIKVSKGLGNDEAKAVYQVMFTNPEGEHMFFDDFQVSSSLWPNDYGLSYNGDVYYSPLGKIEFTTLSRSNTQKYGVSVNVAGTHDIHLDILLQDTMTIAFGNDTLNLQAPLESFPSLIYQANQAPDAVIETTDSTVERNEKFLLSAANSTDPNFDLMTFEWKVIESPSDAVFSVSQASVAEFESATPGKYQIELTVDDGNGGIDKEVFELLVMKSLPIVELTEQPSELISHQFFQAQISIVNDDLDGPIDMAIAYGPEQMEITPDGELSWQLDVPDFGVPLKVNFGLFLSNKDKQVIQPFSLMVNSAEHQKTITYSSNQLYQLSAINAFSRVQTQNIDSTKQALNFFKGDYFEPNMYKLYLDQEGQLQGRWHQLFKSDLGDVEQIHDINADGHLDELIKLRSDEGWQIWLKDGLTNALTLAVGLGEYEPLERFEVVNFGSNNDVLVVHGDYALRSPKVYSLPDFELLYETNSSEETKGFCDFNQDGWFDLVSGDQVISMHDDQVLLDFRSNRYDIHIIQMPDECLLVEVYDQSLLYLWRDGGVTSETISVGSYGMVGNFDEHAGQELITLASNSDGVYPPLWDIHHFSRDGVVSTQTLTQADGVLIDQWNRSHAVGGFLGVADVDGDGTDEILSYINRDNSLDINRGVIAVNVDGNELVKTYESEKNAAGSVGSIVDFTFNGQLTIANSNRVSVIDQSGLLNDWTDTSDVIKALVNDGQLYYYTDGNGVSGISKYDGNNQKMWDSESNLTTVHVNDFQVGHGLVYLSSTSESLFIDDQNGNTILHRNIDANLSFLPIGRVFFDEGLQQLREILDDSRIVNLLADDSGAFWQSIPSVEAQNIQYLQYDDDPQEELVVRYNESMEEAFGIFDSLTAQREPLKPWHEGLLLEANDYAYQQLEHCPMGAVLCRNLLVAKDNILYLKDKISGHVIWQSPKFVDTISDARLLTQNNRTKLVINGAVGAYIFE